MTTTTTLTHDKTMTAIDAIINVMKKKCSEIIRTTKAHMLRFHRKAAYLMHHTGTQPAIHIEHLHKSYRSMDEKPKQVFVLYVRGYSMNEISMMSGTKRSSVLKIVYNALSSFGKNNTSAQA